MGSPRWRSAPRARSGGVGVRCRASPVALRIGLGGNSCGRVAALLGMVGACWVAVLVHRCGPTPGPLHGHKDAYERTRPPQGTGNRSMTVTFHAAAQGLVTLRTPTASSWPPWGPPLAHLMFRYCPSDRSLCGPLSSAISASPFFPLPGGCSGSFVAIAVLCHGNQSARTAVGQDGNRGVLLGNHSE